MFVLTNDLLGSTKIYNNETILLFFFIYSIRQRSNFIFFDFFEYLKLVHIVSLIKIIH